MPAWVIGLLIKYGIPMAITFLRQSGAINWAEKVALKAGYEVYEDAQGIKIFNKPDVYPTGRNGQTSDPTAPNNINKGEP